jgi:hypothetical protein
VSSTGAAGKASTCHHWIAGAVLEGADGAGRSSSAAATRERAASAPATVGA